MSDSPSISILYENGPLVVVFKPPGLLTQSRPGIDSAEAQLRELLRARQDAQHDAPGDLYLAALHRLDRPVSGVLAFATEKKAARKIGRQFERRKVKKIYWAAVEGMVEPSAGTWTDYLRKVPNVAAAEVVPEDHPEAKLAVLHYHTLGTTPHGSWLEIQLETGRTHQIRIQAAHRGHPAIGDAQYGSQVPFGEQHADERLRAIALHGRSIEILHPETKELVDIFAPPPQFWAELGVPDRPPAAGSGTI